MNSKNDLMLLLKFVQAHKSIASDIMEEFNNSSSAYMEAKGAYGAYSVIEKCISNMVVHKTEKEKVEV